MVFPRNERERTLQTSRKAESSGREEEHENYVEGRSGTDPGEIRTQNSQNLKDEKSQTRFIVVNECGIVRKVSTFPFTRSVKKQSGLPLLNSTAISCFFFTLDFENAGGIYLWQPVFQLIFNKIEKFLAIPRTSTPARKTFLSLLNRSRIIALHNWRRLNTFEVRFGRIYLPIRLFVVRIAHLNEVSEMIVRNWSSVQFLIILSVSLFFKCVALEENSFEEKPEDVNVSNFGSQLIHFYFNSTQNSNDSLLIPEKNLPVL